MSEMESILAISSVKKNTPCSIAKRKRAGFTLLEPAPRYPCLVYFVRPETLKIGNDRELHIIFQFTIEGGQCTSMFSVPFEVVDPAFLFHIFHRRLLISSADLSLNDSLISETVRRLGAPVNGKNIRRLLHRLYSA